MLTAFYVSSHGSVSINSHVLRQSVLEQNTDALSVNSYLDFMAPSVIMNLTLSDDLAGVYFVSQVSSFPPMPWTVIVMSH